MSRKIDLTKVAIGDPTPCSIALVEYLRAEEMLEELRSLKRPLSADDDRRWTVLEERQDALEAQIKREVRERLGVHFDILQIALS